MFDAMLMKDEYKVTIAGALSDSFAGFWTSVYMIFVEVFVVTKKDNTERQQQGTPLCLSHYQGPSSKAASHRDCSE